MNIDKNDACFSIGEFVSICDTTRETLYHYEKQGLLLPSVSQSNGYRYYRPQDYFDFMFIAHLTRVGFSLVEVKHYLAERRIDTYIDAMYTSAQRLQERQEKLRVRNERTQRGFDALKEALRKPLLRPQITYHDEDYYLRLPFDGDFYGKGCVVSRSAHDKYAAAHGVDIHRHFLGFYSESPLGASPPKFDWMISRMNERVDCPALFTRPQGMYVSMCYRGPFTEEGDVAYATLGDYLDRHRFTPLTGMFVEVGVGPFFTANRDDYVAEISVRIE